MSKVGFQSMKNIRRVEELQKVEKLQFSFFFFCRKVFWKDVKCKFQTKAIQIAATY